MQDIPIQMTIPISLVMTILMGFVVRYPAMIRASAALFANWAANTAAVAISGNAYCWQAFASIDFLTACFLLKAPVPRWQIAIIGTYVCEMVAHLGYFLSAQDDGAQYRYWWTLFDVACAQGAVAFVGGVGGGGRLAIRFRDFWSNSLAGASLAGVAAPGGRQGGDLDGRVMDRRGFPNGLTDLGGIVRQPPVQLHAAPGSYPTRPAEIGDGSSSPRHASDIGLGADGCSVCGARNSDEGRGIGDRLLSRGGVARSGDEEMIQHWLKVWLSLRRTTDSKITAHIEKMREAAESLNQTVREMEQTRTEYLSQDRDMEDALRRLVKDMDDA